MLGGAVPWAGPVPGGAAPEPGRGTATSPGGGVVGPGSGPTAPVEEEAVLVGGAAGYRASPVAWAVVTAGFSGVKGMTPLQNILFPK